MASDVRMVKLTYTGLVNLAKTHGDNTKNNSQDESSKGIYEFAFKNA